MLFADLCGWICAISWGIAYYPPLFLNYKLKSSESLSLDSIYLNLLGYFSYTISVALQVFNDKVRSEFQTAYQTLPVLSTSDMFYAIHGLLIMILTFSQCIMGNALWGFHDRQRHRIHKVTQLIFTIFLIFLAINWFSKDSQFKLLNFAINLAYFKVIISCIKYIPQVLQNYRRRSMYGSSRVQIFLDMTGSLFSVLELSIKNRRPLIEAIQLNRGKLSLITISIFFDLVFITQIKMYSSRNSSKLSEKIDIV